MKHSMPQIKSSIYQALWEICVSTNGSEIPKMREIKSYTIHRMKENDNQKIILKAREGELN